MARHASDLIDLLGEPAFVALAEAFGGRKLYLPLVIDADHEIARAIGEAKARLLAQRYAPDHITVPLARELRALHYRAAKLSQAQIGAKLGISDNAVWKLFRRLDAAGGVIAASAGPSPLPLFPED